MKVAIMQPYVFPYIGYFSLIKHTDVFIIFDTPQFIRHGWIERNRILKATGEPMYIKVPLEKHKRETKINALNINNDIDWKNKILAQLGHYKKVAPNYFAVIKLLEDIFEKETTSIVEFNYVSLSKICEYLGIRTPIKIFSDMNLKIDEVNAPDEWALNICKAYGADTYYNPIGGQSFFSKDKYDKENIVLKFLDIESTYYKQFSNEFEPFLSIIDVLMFSDKKEINESLNKVKFID